MAPIRKGKNIICLNCGKEFYVPLGQFKWRNPRFCSKSCAAITIQSEQEYREKKREIALKVGYGKKLKGRSLPDEHKNNISLGLLASDKMKNRGGWKLSDEARKNISDGHKGSKSYLWKGGITKISAIIRTSFEYKEWRKKVFERDGYQCVFCGSKGRLQADHIKPFAKYPELRFDVSNGRTLCVPCHKSTPTYLRR